MITTGENKVISDDAKKVVKEDVLGKKMKPNWKMEKGTYII